MAHSLRFHVDDGANLTHQADITITDGSILYNKTTTLQSVSTVAPYNLAKGGALTILRMDSSGNYPEWAYPYPFYPATTNTNATCSNNFSQCYILNNTSGTVAITLPTSMPNGHIIKIIGHCTGTGLWRVSQNASQQIILGQTSTTVGTGGYIYATHQKDCIELMSVESSNIYVATSAVGNIMVV